MSVPSIISDVHNLTTLTLTQAVHAMETTRDNRILVTGDNLGFIRVWDISDYFASGHTTRERPRQIQEWRAHVQVGLPSETMLIMRSPCETYARVFYFS